MNSLEPVFGEELIRQFNIKWSEPINFLWRVLDGFRLDSLAEPWMKWDVVEGQRPSETLQGYVVVIYDISIELS